MRSAAGAVAGNVLGGGPRVKIDVRMRTVIHFDRDVFQRNFSKINDSPLKHAGLLTRKIWMQSIRTDRTKSQRPAKPGKPPKSRHPSKIFKKVFSLPNRAETSVMVGHVGFGPAPAPGLHEHGERVTIKAFTSRKRRLKTAEARRMARKRFQSGQIKSKRKPTVTKTVQMPKRPHAAPALERAQSKLPPLWANSVRRAGVKAVPAPRVF